MGSYKWSYKWGNYRYNPYSISFLPCSNHEGPCIEPPSSELSEPGSRQRKTEDSEHKGIRGLGFGGLGFGGLGFRGLGFMVQEFRGLGFRF